MATCRDCGLMGTPKINHSGTRVEYENLFIELCDTHSRAAEYRKALEQIRDKRYAEEYHDGEPTGPDAVRGLQQIAIDVLKGVSDENQKTI
jgi:hypothetical protein